MSEEASVVIRPIQETDKDDWLLLWKQYQKCYNRTMKEDIPLLTFERFLDPEVKMWAAFAINTTTNKPIGMVTYLHHFTTWNLDGKIFLHDLFVQEDQRVKGVGRKLMEFVYDASDRMDVPFVYWTTDDFNHRAQLLYTKVGKKTSKVLYERGGYGIFS
ncbi:N-acetyltransferase family protein NDAI_0C02350 [Naumovozyma dairenensis CBS 421]|uniref:N-acetyltransferase domain-containing protein n=1 Tax=Naumovozyma dairenensis (strain ATCC 10597 / BCRC 20456 / CBS 421 / NBRC 0211 / NRRL Y-12639) TaxID=1071378 RepID=G0W7Y4_NAUDC|nr:hypothetical protein NDAI_0C02350 [Naumovozyma dairenensis CBS 421]CCD23895.1 hypothetical protein NDAI_0C02350 [Naumovozyma dairenensis CBS 421]